MVLKQNSVSGQVPCVGLGVGVAFGVLVGVGPGSGTQTSPVCSTITSDGAIIVPSQTQ